MTKILIVEDELLVARMYEKTLKFEGFEVASAIGGKEGLDKVKTFSPDIVLLDIMMPEPNGMEVLTYIKSDPATASIPVVMLTNLSGENDAKLALSRGAADFWVKSDINNKELGKMIQKVLDDQKNKPINSS